MEIYTDGSAYLADGSAGYGVVYVVDSQRAHIEFGPLSPETTPQQAEIEAVIAALRNRELLQYPATIVSDSDYVVKSMNEYAYDWLTRELRLYDIAVFKNDTVPELYRTLRNTIGKDGILGLSKSSGEELANQDRWEILWRMMLKLGPIRFEHVRGHADVFWNNLADFLARQGRELSYEVHDLIRYESKYRDRRIT